MRNRFSKFLAAEGLVMLVQHRGAVVSTLTVTELEEVFPVLAALEGLVGELAALNATKQEIDNISRLNDDMHGAFDRGDRPTYFDLNQKIHAAMLDAARNKTLAQQHQMVARRASRARYQANLTLERWGEAMREHDVILKALEARDSQALGTLMKEHMQHKLHSLVPAISVPTDNI